MENRTTIQISEPLRKKLKVLASYRDVDYEDLLEDLMSVFSSSIPFQNETEFCEWFEKNLDKFGFKKIIERRLRESPDYLLEDLKGKKVNVEIELVGRDFERHKHDAKKTDLVICVYSDVEEIKGVPVLSVLNKEEGTNNFIKRIKSGKHTTISIPYPLYQKIQKFIKNTGFTSSSDFATFILRGVFTEGDDKNYSKMNRSKIVERLKKLGYID